MKGQLASPFYSRFYLLDLSVPSTVKAEAIVNGVGYAYLLWICIEHIRAVLNLRIVSSEAL